MARYSRADKARVLEAVGSHGPDGILLCDMRPDEESIAVRLMLAGLVSIEGTPGVRVNGARAVITSAGRARLARHRQDAPGGAGPENR